MASDFTQLDGTDPTDVGLAQKGVVLVTGLGGIAGLLIADIILDIQGILGAFHIWFEAGSLVAALGLMIFILQELWRSKSRAQQLSKLLSKDQAEIARLNAELKQWQEQNKKLLEQFAARFYTQCKDWSLTDAQTEIARSLLKGESLKEIAHKRGTSEATVRQQASELYRKAGLQGRGELSAFFLNHFFH